MMKSAARAAMFIAPLTMVSVFATAAPALAGASPDMCSWPGTGGVQAVGVGVGTSVVVNSFQFTCESTGSGVDATWHPDGTTSAPDTPYLQPNYDPSIDPSNFSVGVVLVDGGGEAWQDYGGFWNDGGSWSSYDEYGSVDGGGGGVGDLQP